MNRLLAVPLLSMLSLAAFAAARTKPVPTVAPAAPPAPQHPSFRRDVMPVFLRAGCNTGGCHGAASGKDGFHLSLFGYDPAGDYWRLTRQMPGRRLDVALPEQSLLLRKATGVVPHSGGRRFKPDSDYYRTLLNWIRDGAPDDAETVPQVTGISFVPAKVVFSGKQKRAALKLEAHYSDGSSRLVNHLALYLTNNKATADIDDEGVVTGGVHGATYVFARFSKFTTGAEVIVLPADRKWKPVRAQRDNYIDDAVNARLEQLHIRPSELAGDEEFLRRVSLDLIGIPPTPEEHDRFLADTSRNKRERLVESLMARDEFSDLWATRWAEMLKLTGDNQANTGTDRKAAYNYYAWIREQVKRNTPLDQFARAQIASSGSNLHDPPVNLYTMLPAGQYDAKAVAQDVAQVFTGVRIQCAQCHNHPFDRWTQDDYYSFVSFFTGVKRKVASEPREFYIWDDPGAAPARHLLDNRPMPPRFLGGDAPNVQGKDPRVALAAWLTAPGNSLFRENMANRIWAHFFGRGIVEPVDDVRISNPPSNRELIETLGAHLAEYGFDARHLMRDIVLSRTYQLSSVPNASNRDDQTQFSHARLRRLPADVLLDAISQATATPTPFSTFPIGYRAVQLYEGIHRTNDYFLRTFGLAARDSVNASGTRTEPTLAQALHLVNGDTIEGKLARSGVVADLLKQKSPPGEIIQRLYVRTLARRPSADELARLTQLAAEHPADRKIYDDIFWALVNSTEFSFNH